MKNTNRTEYLIYSALKTMLQPIKDLEKWFEKKDPWGYENNSEDKKRKNILLSELPNRTYKRTLDIGCGHGYITKVLPGKSVLGVDISNNAIKQAKQFTTSKLHFETCSLFNLNNKGYNKFDLILITGVLYPQYIGNSYTYIYDVIDKMLNTNGILVSIHINEWYRGRFPFFFLKEKFYRYRDFVHRLEVYIK